MRKFLLPGALALLCSSALPALAQQVISNAAMSGRVYDQTGSEMSGVPVTATHVQTSQRWTAVSDDRGRYRFFSLPVGEYDVSIEQPGFSPFTTRVSLALGAALELPAKLEVAGVSQSVEVVAETPVVETSRTQVAERVTPAEVQTLPLNGRNYLDLALLTPGVSRTNTSSTQRFAETSAVPGTGLSFAGQRNLHTGFVVDGLSANDDAADLAGTFYSQEVIREFQAITSGGIAEFGRASGGIVNIATQAGTNVWMGRVYEFLRHDKFDARNSLAAGKTPLSQQQYGLTFGGPIRRNRTFLFGNFEQTRNNQTGFVTIGDASVAAVNAVFDAFGYGGSRAATGPYRTGYDTTNVFLRVDQHTRNSSHFMLRYNLYDIDSENARGVGGLSAVSRGTALSDRDHALSASLVSPVSGSAINELKLQFTHSRLRAPGNDLTGPAISVAGVANVGASTSSPTERTIDLAELADSVSMSHGSHLLKGGVNLLFNRAVIVFPGALGGSYAFSSLANLQAGRYTTFQQAFGEQRQTQSNPNLGVFLQDQWQPRSDLTVNTGLRYDIQWLADPVQTDLNNIAPRLGAAYAPGDRRTVLRASYGMFYDRIPLRAVSNALQRDGAKYKVAVLAFGQEGAPAFPNVTDTFPAGVVTAITTIDPQIKHGVSHQANVQVERSLGPRAALSIGYLRTRGMHVIMSRNINVPTLSAAEAAGRGVGNLGRPDPRVGNNSQYQSIGDSWFNGMTLGFNAQKLGRATVRVSYTLSKAVDDFGNAFFSSPQDNSDVLGDKGPSDNDQRQRLVLSGSLEWSGWTFSYIMSGASALPFNIVTGSDLNNDTNNNDRPRGVGRNTGVGFSSATLDVRLGRRFSLGGRRQLEVMVEAFNVLNRTNLQIPNNTFGPGIYPINPLPAFGQATAAGDPRQIQLGLRFGF